MAKKSGLLNTFGTTDGARCLECRAGECIVFIDCINEGCEKATKAVTKINARGDRNDVD
jgi:hypothetical protein